ncbi:hypothetical protein CLCR_00133 [Cladophialophora carrionii]|uniref:Uncharacterized protein n=1 Tax=Cladophialophora carrionii TaxID=86049 RepID=A0A1C1C6A5_9EURO|nr:hypothetical protein CLCR_00133 [Cladophialophora carrionii]
MPLPDNLTRPRRSSSLYDSIAFVDGTRAEGLFWDEDCPLATDRIRRYTPSWSSTRTEASLQLGIEWIDLLTEDEGGRSPNEILWTFTTCLANASRFPPSCARAGLQLSGIAIPRATRERNQVAGVARIWGEEQDDKNRYSTHSCVIFGPNLLVLLGRPRLQALDQSSSANIKIVQQHRRVPWRIAACSGNPCDNNHLPLKLRLSPQGTTCDASLSMCGRRHDVSPPHGPVADPGRRPDN